MKGFIEVTKLTRFALKRPSEPCTIAVRTIDRFFRSGWEDFSSAERYGRTVIVIDGREFRVLESYETIQRLIRESQE